MSEDALDVKSFILWVPRGRAAEQPKVLGDCLEEDVTKDTNPTGLNVSDDVSASAIDKELKMDEYDDDDDMAEDGDIDQGLGSNFFGVRKEEIDLIQKGDPLLKGDEDSDEEEDMEIKKDDFVMVVGSVEQGDTCGFVTYTYDDAEKQSYFHHETMLTAFPLCGEYIPSIQGKIEGQHIAIGSFLPIIEIWNNDLIGSLEPEAVLGDLDEKNHSTSHRDAVCSLHYGTRGLLSASHDRTIRLWDVETMKHLHRYGNHKDKVTIAQWHPCEATMFASGGEDKCLAIGDIRLNDVQASPLCIQVGDGIESLVWDRHSPANVICVTNEGNMLCYDVRKLGNESKDGLLWELTVSDEPLLSVTDFTFPGLLATCGEAGSAYLFDIRGSKPVKIEEHAFEIGPLYHCKATPDLMVPSLLALGGQDLITWDVATSKAVAHAFGMER